MRVRHPSVHIGHRPLVALGVAGLLAVAGIVTVAQTAQAAVPFPIENLNGSGNNVANPTWGQSGRPYARVAPAVYADGIGTPVGGPNARYVSNRVINDVSQNVFSERRVTQWGWTWGQFLDHTFGLRDSSGPTATPANIPFNSADPLETFTNDLGVISFTRSAATPGTGTGTANPRQQTNTTSTYLNAFSVYGGTNARLDWLRNGPVDGNPTNNSATLLLPGGYLPRKDARGNAATAPTMDVDGRLLATPNAARVAGDVRANENIALTATHTLFAREHNRIVSRLPNTLSEEDKFQIARRVLMAEQQYVTYQEWLPAMGVALPAYTGYKGGVNATLSNEFATVGYRVHSQIHGEFEFETNVSRYSQADLDFFEAQGMEVTVDGADVDIALPLGVAFFNPDVLQRLQIGPLLSSLLESQYNNDEQIDNQLRSVLFQVPTSSNPDCLDGPTLPQCFRGVSDLGAIDIQRARDHGIPRYNALRQAYGLAPKTSFTAITGEATDQFPAGSGVDNPNSIDVLRVADIDGTPIAAGIDGATSEVRRSTVAARLRGIYGNVNNVDAFAGMIAERHVPGTEFGELQLAIWTRQFQALRDGDRFFFGNDQGLNYIRDTYGIDYRRTLAQIIADNTDTPAANIPANVFLVEDEDLPATTCSVAYTIVSSWPSGYQVNLRITNTGTTPINGWTLRYNLYNGQAIGRAVGQTWNGNFSQSGPSGRDVTVTNASWNGTLAPGAVLDGVGYNASWDNATNAKPPNISLNNHRCAVS